MSAESLTYDILMVRCNPILPCKNSSSMSAESLTYDLLCGITGTSDLAAVKNVTLRIR
jgi:hypothetical protein